jgi:hypothetical protein
LDANRGCDLFVGLKLKDVRDRTPFCRASHLGNFVNFFHVSASSGREEHQVIVRGGGKKMLNEIAFLLFGGAFARLHADDAFAAAPLRAKCAHGRALDKAGVRDADDATLIDDKVFDVDLGLRREQFPSGEGSRTCRGFRVVLF